MKKTIYSPTLILATLTISLFISACTMITPRFDKVAYEKAVSLKVDSITLMDKATEPYVTYEAEVKGLTLRLEKAYEYAKGKPNNEIITKQWLIINDPEKHQIGGFLKRWKEKETLSKLFVNEAKKTIANGFDQVIGLESGLIKAKNAE
jgi:hypothetical protein